MHPWCVGCSHVPYCLANCPLMKKSLWRDSNSLQVCLQGRCNPILLHRHNGAAIGNRTLISIPGNRLSRTASHRYSIAALKWWTLQDSNPPLPLCKRGFLPHELSAHNGAADPIGTGNPYSGRRFSSPVANYSPLQHNFNLFYFQFFILYVSVK